MIKLANQLRGNVFLRYVAVSIGALAADMTVFLLLLEIGMPAMAASAVGYSIGIFAHWILSSRKVFHDRVSEKGTIARTQQKAMFLASALMGLVLTMIVVGAGTALGIDARIAKVVAIGTSFMLTYLLRNVVIFRQATVQ
ncbi:GtrA family protein [Sphingorhabdus sp.]|uniref:GtrA family protein n=1 Tax=Sphingorhabdus sp. TaxID=1902408 RepID=UPI003783CA63